MPITVESANVGRVLVLSVSSLKGGVGKTSVVLGLASAAHSRGIPTLVVDVDPQADASTGLDIPVTTRVDIADVLAAPKSKILDDAVVPSGWSEGKPGLLDVVPGSPRAAEFDRPSLSEKYLRRLREAISRLGTNYRLVLIDCPPSLNGLTRAAWTASNRVLVVSEPGLFSVAAADRALRATEELRKYNDQSLQPLGIAVNRVRPNSREHAFRIEELKDMFGPLVLSPPIPERTVLQQAQGSARPIHSWPGNGAAELAGAFDKILDRALRSENIRSVREPESGATGTTGPETPPGTTGSGKAADSGAATSDAAASGTGAKDADRTTAKPAEGSPASGTDAAVVGTTRTKPAEASTAKSTGAAKSTRDSATSGSKGTSAATGEAQSPTSGAPASVNSGPKDSSQGATGSGSSVKAQAVPDTPATRKDSLAQGKKDGSKRNLIPRSSGKHRGAH